MREIRQSGSEGGESDLPYPYSAQGNALGTNVGMAIGPEGAVHDATLLRSIPTL